MSAISDRLRSSAELGYSGNGTRSTNFDNARPEAVDDYIKYIESNVPKKADFSGWDYVQLPVVGNLIGSASSGISGIIGGAAEYAGLNNVADYFQKEAQDREKRMNYWNGEKIAPELSSDYLTGGSFTRDAGNVLGSGLLLAGLGRLMPAAIPSAIGATAIGQVASKVPFFSRLAQGAYEALPSVGLEAIAEGGNAMQGLRQEGVPLEEREQIGQQIASDNAKLLLGTQGLEKTLLNRLGNVGKALYNGEKAGLKTATAIPEIGANWLMQGIEEGEQEGFTNKALGKEYSYNPLDWYNNPELQGQKEAFETGIAGTAPFAMFGLGGNYMANKYGKQPQSDNGIPLYDTQAYNILDEVSDVNATEDTLNRLNALAHAYQEQFGEQLNVTSLKRNGDGSSWHDSGEAFDIVSGGLEANENGEREWLMQKGAELGLTGLDEYANPSDHATGGHIHFSNHNDGGEVDNTASDFDTFMAKVGMQESGGNYDAVNSDSGASGKYQIMPENWSAWAEEAGLDPNSEMTPENQEIVVRNKLKQYYDKYGEEGALVAWYAGETNAQRWVDGEETALGENGEYSWDAPQGNAPSVREYVKQALGKNPNGKSTSKGVTSKSSGIKDTPLEDYLKLFDDGKTENKTYDDYVKLIGNATDEQVMENAEKAKQAANVSGDIESYLALNDMISDGDVEGLRNLAIQQAQSLNNSEVVSEVNEVTTDDVQTEPVKTFDFSEAIDGLRKFAQSGTPEQQQIAQNALSTNAPLVALQAYNHLSNMAMTDAENTVGTEDNIAIGEAINQSANNEPSTNLNQWKDIRNNAAEKVRQRTSNNAQQIAQQQADNLYSNAPLTAQEQATVNSVLNSANGVFSDNIKNELFNALRNGDNAGVRRVINGVPNNIPSQADVNQQAMAEKQKAIDNARLNVNRAMKENYDAFMETLDENEQEFMNFLNEVFYETGKGFKDILDSARNELVLLQQGLQYATNQENVAQEDVAWVNERIGGLQNAIEGLETIAGKAYEFEQRRNELSRQGETGREQSGRNIQSKEITNEIIEIAKAYGVQLKGRLLDNNVPINEKAVDKSLNSENQKEVDHVVERMENIAEKNNVDIEDIKQEAEKKKSLYQQLQDVIAEKTEMLKMYLDYIEKTSGNGIDVVPLNDGSRRGIRVSNNAQWYSDWYEKNKHKHGKMSKRDKLDVAEQMYRGNIEYEPEAGYRPSTQEEADEHEKFIRQANAEMDAINARIEALENAYEEEKEQKKAKAKKSPNKGTSSNAKKESEKNSPSKKSDVAKNATTEKKNTPKATLSEQESQEGVTSEPQKETPSKENKPVSNRKSESQKSEEKPKFTTKDIERKEGDPYLHGSYVAEATMPKEIFDKFSNIETTVKDGWGIRTVKVGEYKNGKGVFTFSTKAERDSFVKDAEEKMSRTTETGGYYVNVNGNKLFVSASDGKVTGENGAAYKAKDVIKHYGGKWNKEEKAWYLEDVEERNSLIKNFHGKYAWDSPNEKKSDVKMVKESEETVSKAEIVGENIRDDFMSKDMKDTVSTFLPVIRQKLNQFFLSAKPHKDKKRDSIYGGRTIEEVRNKMDRLAKSIVKLVDTLSDFTADEKQVMKEVLQSQCNTVIDKAIKQIKDSNTKLAVDTTPEGIQKQAKINREKQLELVKTEFPTATNIVQDEDSIRFNLNDEKVRVDYVDRVIATEERKQAYRRDYGEEYTDDVSILGDTQTIDGEQVITLLNRIGYEDTISHEAFHLAFRTALTKAQQKILLDKYGNEEAVAEAYRELMNKSNARGAMFDMTSSIGRLFQKIWNFANSLFNVFNNGCMLHDAESIMYAIADGSIYELNEKNEKGITAFLHPALLAAWHGTNRSFDEFDLSYNGTGEGSNVHGWGLYFALNKTTSEKYAEFLKEVPNDFSFSFEDAFGYTVIFEWNSKKEKLITKTKFKDGTFSKGSELNKDDYEFEPYYDFVKALAGNEGDMKKVIADLEQFAEDDPPYKGYAQELLDNLKENKITLDGYENPQSVLYKVDVPSTDTMLREDKPFSQQPKQVQEALKKLSSMFSYKELQALNGFYDGGYNMIADKVAQTKQNINEITDFIENGSEREQSDYVDDYNEIKGSSFENLQDILAREEKLLQGYEKDLAQKQKTIELDKEAEKLLNKWKKMDGKAIYSDLERALESPKQASLTLLKSGIQGISYNGSRDDECCVVFNDKAVKILERNGEPISDNNTKLRAVKNTDSQLEAVRKQYEGTDNWLKAPNGKDTNLTERQWLQVRTPNFKKWFGDWENDPENASKIVDENGEPLVVYHGTDTEFDTFDLSEVRDREGSFFFAEQLEDAESYAVDVPVMKVFVNVRNPFDYENGEVPAEYQEKWDNIKNKREQVAILKELGYDGWTSDFENGDGWGEISAFNSNQIKSATDNSGEFSTDSDNIKYSRAVPNPNSAESLKKNGDTDTRLDKLPKVDVSKLTKGEKAIQQFGKSLGIPVHFVVHPDKGFRGVFTHNGEIFINRNSSVPVKDVFIHEFVHWLKASENKAIFDSLSACLENLKGVSHAKRLSEYRKSIYNGENMTDNEIIEEMICDAISHTETANKLFNAINDINPTMAEKVLGYMKHLWDKLCKATNYRQDLLTRNQKLPNKLSAEEMANINATLHNLLMNVKGKDGKSVFVMKNGKMVVRKTGNLVSDTHVAQPINDTVEVEPQKEQAKRQTKPTTEETASTDTKGMVQKATKALAERLGFSVEADKNVTVNRKSTNPQDINVLNRIFNSPSYIARYNKLLAPLVSMAKSAVDKQEKLRYEFREALNDVEKILGYNKWSKNSSEYKENKEALNEILINGDMAGREYSNEELRKQGYNEQVIKAYTKMRQTLNKAWKMLDDITSRMKFGTRNLTEGELHDLQKKNPFLEITSVSSQEDDNGRKKYTYKYPSVDNITEHLLKPELDELKKNPDVKVISEDKLSGGEYVVKYVQRRRIGKIEGYVPHIFHEWSVVEVDNNGKILKDENGNSKFLKTFNSMNDAIKFANKEDKSKKYKVMPKLHEVPGASERSAIIEDYNYLKIMDKVVEDFTLTPSEAVDLMNSGIKTGNRGRFLGNLMKRKGVKGYEKDMMYATYQYFNQVGRYVALDPFKRLAYSLYEKQFGKWEDEKVYNGELGQSAKWAKMYINAVNGVPTDWEIGINNALHALGVGKDVAGGRPAIWLAHALTYPMTILKLGVCNVSSALLNITQLCNLCGAMGDASGKNLARMGKAVSEYAKAWANKDSDIGKLLWEDLGLRYQLGMDVAGGYSRAETDGFVHSRAGLISKYSGGLAELQARISKLAGVSMFMFRGTDSFGRGVTLLTAYQKAIDEGKTKTEAIRYAKSINDRVNFDYSVADANGIYNQLGVVANVFLQFKKYPMKQLELFYDIFREQKALNKDKSFTNARALAALGKYMMPYMALSGIAGVPFIGLVGSLVGLSGDDDRDLVERLKSWARETGGEDNPLVNWFNYGLLGMIGINAGSRIGVGDFLGDSGIKQTRTEMLLGGATTFGSTLFQTHKQLMNGNYAEALKALNPSLGNIAVAYNGEVRTTRGRLKYQYQDNWEKAIRILGFTPVKETLTSEQASEDYYNRQQEQAEKQAAIDEFIAHPTPANAKTLNELGITPKSIQTERERKGKNRHEINEETKKKKEDKQKKDQTKGKKPKVYTVQDYQRAIKK